MKTLKTHLKVLALFFSILIFFQGCTVYKTANDALPIPLSSQEKEYRIITNKLDTVYGKQYFDGKKNVVVIDSNGNTRSLGSHKILSIRREIEGWQYFDWGPGEFTDYLNVNIDSMSREELFIRANEWLKEYFISTEHDFLIQPDSLFAEYQGRKLYRYPEYWKDRKNIVSRLANMPTIIPELKYKFSVDKENYKITLVAHNELTLHGDITKNLVEVNYPNFFYTVELTFFDGGYKIDPVDLFYCYLWDDGEGKYYDRPNFWEIEENILYPWGRVGREYYRSIPFDVSHYSDESGTIRPGFGCRLSRIEILFNDLNRTLFNYVTGNKSAPNIYVYYPETNCQKMWRRF